MPQAAAIRVYLKTTDLEYIFDPEFEVSDKLYDGFNKFYKTSSAIETENAELSFIAPKGKRPDVKIYYDPEIDYNNDVFVNYGTDVTSELYDSINQVCKLPKVYNENIRPEYLVIAEAVSDSGINFTYDKTPKFREQETPHVYFDTVKGSSGGTEKRRYTYATADSSVIGYMDEKDGRINCKKIHDFMSEEDLLNSDKIKMFQISNPENEIAISSEDVFNAASNVPDYPGEALIVISRSNNSYKALFFNVDSAYGSIDALSGDGISFPEPGLYVSDAADEEDTGLIITVEIPATNTNPFSKNVTVKAHTEYTAHINGRIGESSDLLNGYSFSKLGLWGQSDDYMDFDITGVANCNGSFETAKATLLAGKKVIGFINTTDKHPDLEPVLFDTIIDDFWGSGLTGIRAYINNRYECLLATDNKLYLHHAE